MKKTTSRENLSPRRGTGRFVGGLRGERERWKRAREVAAGKKEEKGQREREPG
jgi:hypothetical protein